MKQPPLVENPELGTSPEQQQIPPAPPAPPTQPGRTAFDKPRRRKNPVKAFFKWTGLAALLLCGTAFGYLKFTKSGQQWNQTIKEYAPAVIQEKMNPGKIFEDNNSDIVNILLIGRDVNWKMGHVLDPHTGKMRPYQVIDKNTAARSDTMIVVSLDRTRNEIHMVSLPRDAKVHMPPNKYDVRRAKLNAAHAYGGPQLLMQTIHDELGLTIHHYAVIKFEGFKKLIDQVGGVQVDVLGALKRGGKRGNLDYDDNWGNLHIHLKPGVQTLDGQQAHNYVRFRMDLEGDPGRIKRQQQVMRALAKSLMHERIDKVPALIQEIRRQFETDMNTDDIVSAANFAQSIGDASKIQPVTMFGVYGTRGSLVLNKPKNIKLFTYLFGSTFNAGRFLENSPSTDSDEMGEENNSSPGAKAILRKAGLIKGEPGDPLPEVSTPAGTPETPSNVETSEDFTAPVTDSSASRLAVSNEETATPSETPRRRRSHRERREESSSSERRESSSRSEEHDSVELSVPEGDGSSDAPARSDSSESPVPEPESSSPVPKAE